MADSQSPSDAPDRTNRQDVELWLEARSLELANLISTELFKITTEAFEQYIESVDATAMSASGDMYTIDSIIPKWEIVAKTKVIPNINQTFLSGGISAFAVSDSKKKIPNKTAVGWADVVNQQAVEYALAAENRLRDVGKTVWNDIRKKVSKSIEQGNSGEELKNELEQMGRFSEYRADTIARTETSAAYLNGTWSGDQALGEYGPVEKVWVATADARSRESHINAMSSSESNPVPFNEPFNVGGVSMMFPHAPGAPAKEVVNCRCYYESYYIGDTRPDGSVITPESLQNQTGAQTQAVPEMSPTVLEEPIDYTYKVVNQDLLPWTDRADDWRGQPDPTKRAVGMWQFEASPQQAIRQMINNRRAGQPEMAGIEPLSDVSVTRLGTFKNTAGDIIVGLDGNDLMNEARLASRILDEQLETGLERTTQTLFRGMRMDFEESKEWFANIGDEIDLPLSSWTEKASEARLYSSPRPEQRRTIMIELQEGADTLPIYRNSTGRFKDSREHLSPPTRYRVVSKKMQKNEIKIVLAPV